MVSPPLFLAAHRRSRVSLAPALTPHLVFPRGEDTTNPSGVKRSVASVEEVLLGEIRGALCAPCPSHHGQDQCEAAPGEDPSLGSKAGTSRATSHGINWILLIFFFFFLLLYSSFVSKDISSENHPLARSGE